MGKMTLPDSITVRIRIKQHWFVYVYVSVYNISVHTHIYEYIAPMYTHSCITVLLILKLDVKIGG